MSKKSQDEKFEIDFSGITTASDLSYSSVDTISITGSDYAYDYNNMSTTISGIGASTITLPSSAYTIGSNSNYAFNTSSGYNGTSWTGSTGTSTVNISTDGIDMAAGTDIKIDGKSLKDFISKMEDRLAILVPDPAKLEKFEALKRAYEHYKTMESLCFDEPKEED